MNNLEEENNFKEEIESIGKCIYCGELFSQKEISKHLAKHLAEIEKKEPEFFDCAFHLTVYSGKMFLELLVKGEASFKTLDTFLRKIWLDCCGHLSNFSYKNFKIGMSDKFNNALTPNLKFTHIYDYGSTTMLDVKVKRRYNFKINNNIILLSRNEPLKIMCSNCNAKPASVICIVHMDDDDDGYYCDDCISVHEEVCSDFEDYALMHIVNSPRMGVCGYEGGSIDMERDGVYKEE